MAKVAVTISFIMDTSMDAETVKFLLEGGYVSMGEDIVSLEYGTSDVIVLAVEQ